MRLKLDPETLGLTVLIERLTGVKVKDCFVADQLYVIVPPGYLGRTVGKGGVIIKKVQEQVKKKVKVVEYNESLSGFLKNFIYPLKVEEIVEDDGKVFLRDSSRRTKSTLIGRGGSNLQIIQRAVNRFFPGREVKVE
jgi:transcription termination/antitermination protein NusA